MYGLAGALFVYLNSFWENSHENLVWVTLDRGHVDGRVRLG
jgi:hypothetical protein